VYTFAQKKKSFGDFAVGDGDSKPYTVCEHVCEQIKIGKHKYCNLFCQNWLKEKVSELSGKKRCFSLLRKNTLS
jgi:hypothetical protein